MTTFFAFLFAFSSLLAAQVVKQHDELDWKVSGSLPAGIATHDYHLIHEDKATRGITTLVRFSAGYVLPPHTHTPDEILVVLKGKLAVEMGGKTSVLKPGGYNIGINLGRVAGAGFPGHLHIHIVPRWYGDVNFMPVVANTKVISQSLRTLHDRLCHANKKRNRRVRK